MRIHGNQSQKKLKRSTSYRQKRLPMIFGIAMFRQYVSPLECFQMKTHSVKKCSGSNKVLAHTKKRTLAPILYVKNFDKGLRKAKNCKIYS